MAGVSVADPRVSFAELCQWPDDGRRYELYDGEVIVVPSSFPRHQRVANHIQDLLREYEAATGGLMFGAPLDIVLTEFDVVQPDIVFFRAERRHLIKMWESTRVPPDLAVEVLSRSTERRDRGRKMDMLARSGVPDTGLSILPRTFSRCISCKATATSWPRPAARPIMSIRRRCLGCRSTRAGCSKNEAWPACLP